MRNEELDLYVMAYLSGRKDVFGIIYDNTKKSVYYTISILTDDKNLIEDLVQLTYIQAARKLDSYKLHTSFIAWICKIAHNITLNELNKLNNNQEILLDISNEDENLFKSYDTSYSIIDEAISYLTGEEKDVFIYLYVNEFTVKEIANIMKSSINHIYYVHKKIIETLRPHFVK